MDIQYPFNLLPEEDETFYFSNIGVTISTDKGMLTLQPSNGNIVVSK